MTAYTTATLKALVYSVFPTIWPSNPLTPPDSARINMCCNMALGWTDLNETNWGVQYPFGLTLLAAHYIVRTTPGESNSGTVIEEENDSKRTKYHDPKSDSLYGLNTTEYGKEFEAMQIMINSQNTQRPRQVGFVAPSGVPAYPWTSYPNWWQHL